MIENFLSSVVDDSFWAFLDIFFLGILNFFQSENELHLLLILD